MGFLTRAKNGRKRASIFGPGPLWPNNWARARGVMEGGWRQRAMKTLRWSLVGRFQYCTHITKMDFLPAYTSSHPPFSCLKRGISACSKSIQKSNNSCVILPVDVWQDRPAHVKDANIPSIPRRRSRYHHESKDFVVQQGDWTQATEASLFIYFLRAPASLFRTEKNDFLTSLQRSGGRNQVVDLEYEQQSISSGAI